MTAESAQGCRAPGECPGNQDGQSCRRLASSAFVRARSAARVVAAVWSASTFREPFTWQGTGHPRTTLQEPASGGVLRPGVMPPASPWRQSSPTPRARKRAGDRPGSWCRARARSPWRCRLPRTERRSRRCSWTYATAHRLVFPSLLSYFQDEIPGCPDGERFVPQGIEALRDVQHAVTVFYGLPVCHVLQVHGSGQVGHLGDGERPEQADVTARAAGHDLNADVRPCSQVRYVHELSVHHVRRGNRAI